MKKALLLFTVLIGSFAQAESPQLIESKILIANVYADQLIEQFDQELKLKKTTNVKNFSTIMGSDLYAQILAARSFIENYNGKAYQIGQKSLLQITNQNLYSEVVSEIIKKSKRISRHKKLIEKQETQKQLGESLLFPSKTSDGNVTGNTFPTNVWSLTYDDGPHETITNLALDNLYLHNMQVTFFVLMRQVNKYPKVLGDILNSRMELALHSYNHLDLNKADNEVVDYEIGESKKELEVVSQRNISLFRLPYGSGMRNTHLRQKIADNKLIHIFWNVDTLDWKDKDPKSIFERTKLQMSLTPNKSGIILFHDIHPQSIIASEMVMNYLNEQDKKVCVVGEVINYLNGVEQSCL
jgi:peptidoglycan/xylan/chitin deacetylase (PgdA/CDA1 family)